MPWGLLLSKKRKPHKLRMADVLKELNWKMPRDQLNRGCSKQAATPGNTELPTPPH